MMLLPVGFPSGDTVRLVHTTSVTRLAGRQKTKFTLRKRLAQWCLGKIQDYQVSGVRYRRLHHHRLVSAPFAQFQSKLIDVPSYQFWMIRQSINFRISAAIEPGTASMFPLARTGMNFRFSRCFQLISRNSRDISRNVAPSLPERSRQSDPYSAGVNTIGSLA
jgi:hypothetical protein